jgi:hypothetical protein
MIKTHFKGKKSIFVDHSAEPGVSFHQQGMNGRSKPQTNASGRME